MTEPIDATGINQTDYMKLFMQELTYQDPLKPVDNREFMAQMAQFSSLQETKATNENLIKLLGMTSGSQSLSLLGKTVRMRDSDQQGIVSKVEFFEESPPLLSVTTNKTVVKVDLKQISQVFNGTSV
jgi:flagellar basal-body rod modification protein FlgD